LDEALCYKNDDESLDFSIDLILSGQRLGKHVYAETNTHAAIELLLETGCFYVVRAEML
jgi:hypothetical protein